MTVGKSKKIIILLLVVALILLLAACSYPWLTDPAQQPLPVGPPAPTVIKIAAVGDFLMHMPIVHGAANPVTGNYDFKPLLKEISPYFTDADYVLANLETRLAGRERGYSGYPLFNSPSELASDMRQMGIDMVLTANNHSLDMGVKGLQATLDNLDAAGLDHIGTYRSREDREQPFIKDINGIRIGFLNYTQSTNGIPVSPDRNYLVNMIDRNLMLADVAQMKEAGADFIVACPHFGTEYQRQPDEIQKTVALELLQAGADAVLGNHVHVVQPMEYLVLEGSARPALVVYSLGNFISNQRWRYSDSGIMVNLIIEKGADEPAARLSQVEWLPVWVHTYPAGGKTRYRVLPVDEAIAWYEAGEDPLLTTEDYHRLLQVRDELEEHLGQRVLLPPD